MIEEIKKSKFQRRILNAISKPIRKNEEMSFRFFIYFSLIKEQKQNEIQRIKGNEKNSI